VTPQLLHIFVATHVFEVILDVDCNSEE
jgi:hypothetical protein